MDYKKRSLIVTIFIIIIIQVFLYINNTQKSSFKYFIWELRELKVGKLISISFVSGLLIGTILNKTMITYNSTITEEENQKRDENLEEFSDNDDNIQSSDMPPQRDIRDPQPTISVNYRVVKSNEDNYQTYDQNFSKDDVNEDDWNNENNDW